ncbi:MAG: hypothetical protein MMC33_001378 [Icmadophila ericetorum]|nr:hypothetical protein [Icmadophila ericetorum]
MLSNVLQGHSPLAKRQKLTNGNKELPRAPESSRIFTPYRTLGLVSSTGVPFTSIALGKTTFQITTSVGRCLHTYDLRKGLTLTFITRPQTPTSITATSAWKDRVFAAWGSGGKETGIGIWVFKRGKLVAEIEVPEGLEESIKEIIAFGSWIVGCCATRLEVWKSTNYEHYTTLTSTQPGQTIGQDQLSGVICHMPTLLNKVFAGKQDGSIELWNLSTGKLIYTFSPPDLHTGPVTALQPSPALAILAIGRANGTIVLHDVRADKEVIQLSTGTSGSSSITSISFRTDGIGAGDDGHKAGVLASTCADSGDVTLWDLNGGGRVMGVLRDAHNPAPSNGVQVSRGISRIEFLIGQPILITSGLDNALKSWIFDESPFSPVPRILHRRTGHAAPVTCLSFLPVEAEDADYSGKWLMSAGRDQSLWAWSIRRDGQSTELSQGNIQKKARKLGLLGKGLESENNARLEDLKAPEITCIACSLNRDGGMGASTGGGAIWANIADKKGTADASEFGPSGWESVVTGHKGDKFARTWFWGRKKAGRWAFETSDGTEVKSVAITLCGTFALVGSAAGGIDMFNLQSGMHRQRFPSKLTPAQARKLKIQHSGAGHDDRSIGARTYGLGEGKHTKAVTGIVVDSLNRTVVSCGLDGKIKFWDFLTGIIRHEIDWHSVAPITALRYHRSSDLIALSCDDLSIRVVDIETRKTVRELWGCVGQISDFCFSNDGRWIIAASMDSIIRVWDLPTGHLIDAFRINDACTALAFSTTGEFLATAHANNVGINLWTNRTIFTRVPTRHITEDDIVQAALPTSSGEGGKGLIEAAFEDRPEDTPEDMSLAVSTDQLSQDLMTLSLIPRSRVQMLLHLETIAQRNKPIEPPKAPEKAPFFLPSSLSLSGTTALPSSSTVSATGHETQASEFTNSQVALAERTRISKLTSTSNSEFTSLLHAGADSSNFEPFITHLKSLSPSVADIEIRSLSPLPRSSALPAASDQALETNEITLFIRALTTRLRQRRDYELVQVWMRVFLRTHGDIIATEEEENVAETNRLNGMEGDDRSVEGGRMKMTLREWLEEQQKEGERISALIGYCSGVLGFLRSAR